MMKHSKLALIVILLIIGSAVANNEVHEASLPNTLPESVSELVPRSVGLCDIVPTSQEPLKLLVPLYVYPGAVWDKIIQGASKVPTIVVINPHTGPTPVPNSDYVKYMDKLKTAGIEMIGYVHTSYGLRSIADVKKDIDTYAANYPLITGIFFDEVSRYDSDLPYYTQGYNYVVQKGFKHSILNPGTQPAEGYLAISTSIVIFEDAGSKFNQYAANYQSYIKCAPSAPSKSGYKYKFAAVAHSTQSASVSSLLSSMYQKGVGLVYVTDELEGCCTYNTLVSYYSNMATSIQTINK